MKNLLFILILFLTACHLAEPVEVVSETAIAKETVIEEGPSASARGQINISAAITNFQLNGESDDFAFIEFTIAPNQVLPAEINFDFGVDSNFEFEGIFSVSNVGWSMEDIVQNGSANAFTCTIIYNNPYPTSFVIEDIICQNPTGGECGECVYPPYPCVSFTGGL